ncbi:PREDICTED: maternal protein tudor-like [Papilio polytes]|uniref:maternal protein tudor-like n=1 Tax=Papilio polytes TaxID=76194 RepID=UPI0006760DCF|nr:PREDICTED: maternal protein tudor-like [Papilio polytes]
MALPNETLRSFHLYVTHVDGEGHFLKISGQLDQPSSLMIESLFDGARESLEKGVGAVPPAVITEGIICAAKYKDGKFYRAKIINITNLATGLVGVHFIDYGNKDIISVSTIRFLDTYDPLFLQMRGQSSDYYLSRVMHPSGRWEEPLLLKLQSLLCNAEYPATTELNTRTLPIISIQFKGNDLSSHLVTNRFGIALPLVKQEALLLQLLEKQQMSNWQPTFLNESHFSEHVPFLINQNFPNPASAMRLNQGMSLPINGSFVPPPINQRLLINKVPRNHANLKAPIRQPHTAAALSPALPVSDQPSPVAASKPPSPKKSITYKSRLLEVNSQHKVFVSFAEEGPELFAVQLVSDAKKLQDMMDEINKRPHSSLKEPPMIGTVCLGRMSGDRIICRAIVMNLSGSQCKLFFVDFGDTEMVSYYDIFDIPEEFVKPNVFALRFCLSQVKKLEKGPYLNETFKQLVNGKVLTLKVVSPEGPPLIQYGELFLDNKNVLDLLTANMKDQLQFKWVDLLPLGNRRSVLVSYVDSCLKFYVQLSDKIDELNAVMEAVKAHCESKSSPGELPVGAACCARFPDDDNWYRARVKDTKGNKVIVTYVDYGNEQEVNVSDLRTITPDLIRLPAQALKCALKGYENKAIETKTSNQLEMLALEKTLMAHIVGMLSSDTMLVTLVDDTVTPPLDVARRMNQLSQPRSVEAKATTPVRADPPENFSSPDSVSDDGRKKNYRREKSFKEDRRPPKEGNEEFGQRGSSFRGREHKDGFDRSGPGRHSDKFGGKPDRGDRRGKPRENHVVSPSQPTDNWDEGAAAAHPQPQQPSQPSHPQHQQPAFQPRQNNREYQRENKPNQDEWEEKDKPRENRRENRGDRRDNWGDKKENWNQKREFRDNRSERGERTRSNFTPRDRAERSDRYGSDTDKKSDKSFRSQDSNKGDRAGRAPPYKSRSKFTQVQYKELPDPVTLDTLYAEQTIEANAQHEVSVTWIISPENFYTQILSLQPKFLEMMHSIPELYKGVKSYTGIVPVGASVLARYPADGVLYRATVVSVQPFSKFIVRYVDFGNKQLVDAKDIWQLDKQLLELPKMAVHCSLVGVSPKDGEWKADPEIDLCFNAPRYQCVFQENMDGQYKVSLWNNGVSVADTLVEKQLAILSEHQSSVTLKDEAIDLTIIIGQQILCRVTHVESLDKFYVQLDLDKADLVESAIANFDVNKLTPLGADSLAEGIHCTVRHEEKIYRAILNDVSDTNNIKAVLPDYGHSITTSLQNVMILPTELSVYYYQTLECGLHNYSGDVTALLALDDVRARLTHNKFIIYINSVEGIRLLTTLYDPSTGQKIAIFDGDTSVPVDVLIVLKDIMTYVDIYVNGQNITDKLVSEGHATRSEENECGDLPSCFASHVNSPSEFWIQLETATAELQAMEAAMVDAENFPELKEREEGVICAAKYPEDGAWYRAQVIVDGSEGTEVLFMDYGNASIANELRSLSDELKVKPALSRKCALQKPRDIKSWSRKSEIKFNELAAEGATIFNIQFIAAGDISIVELYLEGKSVTEELVGLCEEQPMSERPTPLGQDLHTSGKICYVHSLDEFYVQTNESDAVLDKITEELSQGEEFEQVPDLKVGSVCAALWAEDEQWYRAKILEFCDVGYHVQFIDYGNKAKCDTFRQLPEDLSIIEPIAKCCRLASVSNEDAKVKLEELAADGATTFQIEFLDSLKEPTLVKLLLDGKDVCSIILSSTNLKEKIVTSDKIEEAVVTSQEVIEEETVAEPVVEKVDSDKSIEEETVSTTLDTSEHKSPDLSESVASNSPVEENKLEANDNKNVNESETRDQISSKIDSSVEKVENKNESTKTVSSESNNSTSNGDTSLPSTPVKAEPVVEKTETKEDLKESK